MAQTSPLRFYKRAWISRVYHLYSLEKEILPSGKVLRYRFDHGAQAEFVESTDPKERYVYASLRIDGSPQENCNFTSSSGMRAKYIYQRTNFDIKIKEKNGHKKLKREYQSWSPATLCSVSSPSYRNESSNYCGRFLLDSYSGKDHIFKAAYSGFGNPEQHYRVHKLLLPVGENHAFVSVYELNYQPPVAGQRGGTTTVKNSDGTSTTYHFSANLLPTLIQYFGNGNLKKEKTLSWDDRNWLKSIEMKEGQGNLLYQKSYEYDRFGNPNLEILTGDLTGEGNQETYTTKRTFSEDGRHLLLREETEDGKVICLSYLPNTNLATSKLTKDVDKIILREFWIYDDCNNLIQTISDDGASEDKDDLSNVTQRTLTATPRASPPPSSICQSGLKKHTGKWCRKTSAEDLFKI